MATVPAELARRAATVDAALGPAVEPALDRVRDLHPSLGSWADELGGMLAAGGKRLRPALLLLGHAAVAPEGDEDAVLPAALALELLHTCALLHDDLLDDAPTRRGRVTAHESFAATHREQDWAGDDWRYGAAAAVLVGDLAFVTAGQGAAASGEFLSISHGTNVWTQCDTERDGSRVWTTCSPRVRSKTMARRRLPYRLARPPTVGPGTRVHRNQAERLGR